MAAPVYLVSDVHLCAARPARTSTFLAFVRERVVPESAGLVVAGDLFDWLYGVPGMRTPPHVAEVLSVLEDVTRVLWMEGNHDLFLTQVLSKTSPIATTPDPVDLDALGLPVHVAHGDLVDERDRGYRRFRTLLRGAPGRLAARGIGAAATQWIGGEAAARSRAAQGGEDGHDGQSARWLDAAQRYASARRSQGAALTVLGHGHWLGWWPGLICLGDWLRWNSYLRIDERGPRLMRYSPAGDVHLASEPVGAVVFSRS